MFFGIPRTVLTLCNYFSVLSCNSIEIHRDYALLTASLQSCPACLVCVSNWIHLDPRRTPYWQLMNARYPTLLAAALDPTRPGCRPPGPTPDSPVNETTTAIISTSPEEITTGSPTTMKMSTASSEKTSSDISTNVPPDTTTNEELTTGSQTTTKMSTQISRRTETYYAPANAITDSTANEEISIDSSTTMKISTESSGSTEMYTANPTTMKLSTENSINTESSSHIHIEVTTDMTTNSERIQQKQ